MKRLLVAATALVLVGACALPEDPEPRVITAEEAPLALSDEAPTAEDVEPGEVRANIYFLDPTAEVLVRVRHPVPSSDDTQVELTNAIQSLLDGPTDEDQADQYRSAIPVGTSLLAADVQDGVAMIDLGSGEGGVGSLQAPELLKVFAQIVYTATDIDGVDSVLFSVNGSSQGVPTEADAGVETPVRRTDYPSFAPESS